MNSALYAQTGLKLLELSETCVADTILSNLLSDTAATVFERAAQILRRQPDTPEVIQENTAGPVEMPPLEEVNGGEWRTLTIGPETASASPAPTPILVPPGPPGPPASVAPSRATTVSAGPNKFQDWVREMKLPAGAKFAILKAGRPEKEFRLSFNRQGKAILTTSFADGTVITGSSPSGVYRAFIKKMTGKDCGQVDAWKKICLLSPAGGGWQPISNPNWLLLELDWSS
jgi:hypothetical protein